VVAPEDDVEYLPMQLEGGICKPRILHQRGFGDSRRDGPHLQPVVGYDPTFKHSQYLIAALDQHLDAGRDRLPDPPALILRVLF